MERESNILVVEDSQVYQMFIENILDGYNIIRANDGIEAIEALSVENSIDIVLLDIHMPRMNGFEVLAYIDKTFKTKDFSVIVLTNYEEIENEIKALELGAVDYLRKPLNAASLLKRLEVHLNLLEAKREIERHSKDLEKTVEYRTEELVASRDQTINALVSLLEVRDLESSDHTIRTKEMIKVLGEHLSHRDDLRAYLTEKRIDLMYRTAPLHDIGKVGIPDCILLKPGRLTDDEYKIMKEHVLYGVKALSGKQNMKESNDFMSMATNIIKAHHERYDGNGYPNKLKGEDIPVEGRMMALVDVYDALISKRVYKEAYSHEKAMAIIIEERGKHFDPQMVDAFIEIQGDIIEISKRYNANLI